jgi:hypothetical protein
MYLDDEMVDIEHLCCLAHADNKFKDALYLLSRPAEEMSEKMHGACKRPKMTYCAK